MSKISDLLLDIQEIVNARPLSLTAQRMIKGSQQLGGQGVTLKNKLKTISEDLKQVKREAKGLDNKTERKLDSAISELSNIAFDIGKNGLAAVESNED